MKRHEADLIFWEIYKSYRGIKRPIYRNLNEEIWQKEHRRLIEIKSFFEGHAVYASLINSLSQTLKKIESNKESWSNFSERGMNKVIPPVMNNIHKDIVFPVEWKDKWGNRCSMNGYWGARNYMVMDVIGYMLLLKSGRNAIPKNRNYIFDDLNAIGIRESQLALTDNIDPTPDMNHSIGFTDDSFRQFAGFNLSSNQIKDLLIQTSQVEFKISYPVRLKNTPGKESQYTMNGYSRFYTITVEEAKKRKDGVVLARKYRIYFNTLLGELFTNNILAKSFSIVDNTFYKLPASAQIFYRRQLLHNNYTVNDYNLDTIMKSVGYNDKNITNLLNTLETNIFCPLKDSGLIRSYKQASGLQGIKYHVTRAIKNDAN